MIKFKQTVWTLFLGLGMVASFSACTSDEVYDKEDGSGDQENVTPEGYDGDVKTVMLSRKTQYGNDWIYYSLSEGRELKEVNEANHMDNLTWDLAFNRYNIRTNGGKSGKGLGAAMDSGKKDMKAVTTVPTDSTFVVDTDAMITGSFTGSGITEVESTLNSVLARAIFFQGPPPSYTPSNHVYVVKTADGKYAKLQVLGFHNKKGKSGFVSFRYKLQTDGSENLN